MAMTTLEYSKEQKQFMLRALAIAKKACGMTSPNPMVGAVLVKAGKIIAEDYHKRAGEPHAEALVINYIGKKAKGADLYVTLEPCCHTNKRTPPCTKAIIEAGIKRVFVAMVDPNPSVSGCGLKELEAAGIEVHLGLLSEEARHLNEFYIKYITTGRPFVILKTAMTIDGKIADPEGNSKWITSQRARREVHKLRGLVDAVITARGTVLADNPQLTARIKGLRNPMRVIIDPWLDVPLDYRVFNKDAPTIVIFAGRELSSIEKQQKIKDLSSMGIGLMDLQSSPFALDEILQRLGGLGISSVMIEAGSSLNGRAFLERVVDKAVFFIAPKLICGKSSLPVTGGNGYIPLENALEIKNLRIRRLGPDIMISGYLRP